MKSLTVRLDDETHKAFKVALAKNGQKAQEVLERAVKEYIFYGEPNQRDVK
jgi:predicted transcriptional regulator